MTYNVFYHNVIIIMYLFKAQIHSIAIFDTGMHFFLINPLVNNIYCMYCFCYSSLKI